MLALRLVDQGKPSSILEPIIEVGLVVVIAQTSRGPRGDLIEQLLGQGATMER